MKKTVAVFALGSFVGALATYFVLVSAPHLVPFIPMPGRISPQPPPVRYSAFWEGYFSSQRPKLVDFYRQYENSDPMVAADVRYILWRATTIPDCDVRAMYRKVVQSDQDVFRRLIAGGILGFTGPECGQDGVSDFRATVRLSRRPACRRSGNPGAQASSMKSAGLRRSTEATRSRDGSRQLTVPSFSLIPTRPGSVCSALPVFFASPKRRHLTRESKSSIRSSRMRRCPSSARWPPPARRRTPRWLR